MADIAAPAPVSGKSWFITALGVAQIASWGSLYYSFPLIATAMESDLGWDKTLIYGSATLGALLSAMLAIPIGKAIDQGHGAGASVLTGLLLALWAQTDNIVLFYVGSAGVGALQPPPSTNRPSRLSLAARALAMPETASPRSRFGAASPRRSSCQSCRFCSIFMAGGGRLKSWPPSTSCCVPRSISVSSTRPRTLGAMR